jgi:hypothetical protein
MIRLILSNLQLKEVIVEQQIGALRAEIASANGQMIQGVCFIVLLMTASYIAAVITGKPELYKLVAMLSLTMVFFVARQDYIIHRAGAFIQLNEVETKYEGLIASELRQKHGVELTGGWETWKNSLRSRIFLLPPLDVLAAIGVFYILVCSQMALWQNHSRFVIATSMGILLGIITIPITAALAGK